MSNYLYHGSIVSNICEIKANSILHGTLNTKVSYLSANYPYSLFYIWDSKHNIKQGKHVTAWIKNGIVFYEEQFKDQLKAFYKDVSGYIYCVEHNQTFKPVLDREAMWYSDSDAIVFDIKYIPDVYAEILKYVQDGLVKIIPFEDVPAEKISALYDHISQNIIKNGLLDDPDLPDSQFYQTYFTAAWNHAKSAIRP